MSTNTVNIIDPSTPAEDAAGATTAPASNAAASTPKLPFSSQAAMSYVYSLILQAYNEFDKGMMNFELSELDVQRRTTEKTAQDTRDAGRHKKNAAIFQGMAELVPALTGLGELLHSSLSSKASESRTKFEKASTTETDLKGLQTRLAGEGEVHINNEPAVDDSQLVKHLKAGEFDNLVERDANGTRRYSDDAIAEQSGALSPENRKKLSENIDSAQRAANTAQLELQTFRSNQEIATTIINGLLKSGMSFGSGISTQQASNDEAQGTEDGAANKLAMDSVEKANQIRSAYYQAESNAYSAQERIATSGKA